MRKRTVVLLLLLSAARLYGAETVDVIPSDISSTSYPSDYGVVTVRAGQLPEIANWTVGTEPPLSVTDALAAAQAHLPKEDKGKWYLSSISLINFGEHSGYGEWYYLVRFYHIALFRKDDTLCKTTTRYTTVVHLDGTVLLPSPADDSGNTEMESVEQVESTAPSEVAPSASPDVR